MALKKQDLFSESFFVSWWPIVSTNVANASLTLKIDIFDEICLDLVKEGYFSSDEHRIQIWKN